MAYSTFAINFFVALFALIDPVGNVALFAAATPGASARERLQLSALISAVVFAFLAFFYFTGLSLLAFFGISLPAFRIAGGVLLFLLGLLIGPGAISPAIIYASQARGFGVVGTAIGVAVMAAVALCCFVCFLATPLITRLLGKIGMTIVVRVLGLILCAMAVQFLLQGLADSTIGLIRHSAAVPYPDG